MTRGEGADLPDLLSKICVLVVDDEPGMRNFLVKTLSPLCRAVDAVGDTEAASARLAARQYDIMILDNIMPGQKGLEWLAEQRKEGAVTDTILITAYADLQTAIEALRAGASDFVLKPFRTNQILNALRRCVELAQLRRENMLLRRELENTDPGRRRRYELVGPSEAVERVRVMLAQVANVATPVLISGASGTGKEVAARHLHARSARARAPFVPIACGSIPRDMIEAELFGHAGGAVAGVQGGAPREGLLASAQGGTVFLDEVAELSPAAQAALLRVLEDGAIRPMGTQRDVHLDLRFVMTTSKPLVEAVAAGRFREDLYFRINVVELRMPLLRERGTDVIALGELFVEEIAARLQLPRLKIDSAVRAAMLRHEWPGNIRELRNFIERSLIFGRFPLETLAESVPAGDIAPLEEQERRAILQALDAVGGNRSEAARRLGVSRKTIERKCAAWGL